MRAFEKKKSLKTENSKGFKVQEIWAYRYFLHRICLLDKVDEEMTN